MSGRRVKRCPAMLVLALLLAPRGAWADGTNSPAPLVFHVGMASVCFLDVNRNDAIAAYKGFLENQGRRIGRPYIADPRVFDDTPGFEAAIQHEPMHMAVMDAWQFLTMDIHEQMRPYFSVMINGKVGKRYLVLTRGDGGLDTLRSLRGRHLLRNSAADATVARIWLDTLLLSQGLETQEKFFGAVTAAGKPTAAILPVFFGKEPACMVDEPTFELMKELNPQVGEKLRAVAVSEKFADVVICLREAGWPSAKDKSDSIQSMNEVHLDPIGQQICTLFKIDRMVPFEESQLDTVRRLLTNYGLARKASAPGAAPRRTLEGGVAASLRTGGAEGGGAIDLALPRAEAARPNSHEK